MNKSNRKVQVCPICNSVIAADCVVCPNCNRKLQNIGMKITIATIVTSVLFALILMAAAGVFEHTHSLVSTTIKGATCTENGIIKTYCSSCDYEYETNIPAKHDWDYEKTIKESSCFFDGLTLERCKVCGKTRESIMPACHSMSGSKCIVCGYVRLSELSVGMTKYQVKAQWGEPIEVDKIVTSSGTYETWWYIANGKTISVHFNTSGKVDQVIYS